MLDRLRARLHRVRPHTAHVDGVRLWIPPGVLDPNLFRSGAWFARHVARRIQPGHSLLDLGCGSGVVGVLAQRAGAKVTAADLNPSAAEAARRNGVADVRHGDLFEPLRGERFDRIAFNPPYFPGTPSDRGFDRALYGGPQLEVFARFLAGVDRHLADGGRAWVVLSDRAPDAIRLVEAAGWRAVVAEVMCGERLSVWRRAAMGYPGSD